MEVHRLSLCHFSACKTIVDLTHSVLLAAIPFSSLGSTRSTYLASVDSGTRQVEPAIAGPRNCAGLWKVHMLQERYYLIS